MLDHLGIQARDIPASLAFYDAVLAPLGARRMLEYGDVVGYGVERPDFWLSPTTVSGPAHEAHIAFTAADRAAVRAFHDAAVAAGAEVLHAPRVWPDTTRPTTARSSATRTATTSRRSATGRSDAPPPGPPGRRVRPAITASRPGGAAGGGTPVRGGEPGRQPAYSGCLTRWGRHISAAARRGGQTGSAAGAVRPARPPPAPGSPARP